MLQKILTYNGQTTYRYSTLNMRMIFFTFAFRNKLVLQIKLRYSCLRLHLKSVTILPGELCMFIYKPLQLQQSYCICVQRAL